jgi:hypothetical protein
MDDLIEQLAATPSALAHLVAEADDAALDAAAPGQWSARTILAHFRDDEYLCTRVALERMLAEEQPELRFIDGADWEPRRNRERERKEWLLADFALQRQASLGVLRLVSASQAQRTGRRDGRDLTIDQLLGVWTRHDREHLTELERLIGETVDQARQRRARWE